MYSLQKNLCELILAVFFLSTSARNKRETLHILILAFFILDASAVFKICQVTAF